jgi:hypothetical protein
MQNASCVCAHGWGCPAHGPGCPARGTLGVSGVGSYLSHVELDTLAELDTFFVYGHCGRFPSRRNTFILMDIKTMLGYLTGFQLDTPRKFLKRGTFSAIIPDNIEKES